MRGRACLRLVVARWLVVTVRPSGGRDLCAMFGSFMRPVVKPRFCFFSPVLPSLYLTRRIPRSRAHPCAARVPPLNPFSLSVHLCVSVVVSGCFFSRPRRSLSLFRARGVVARCRSRVTFFPSCERADSAGVSALLILSAPTLLPLHIGRSGVKVPQPATSCNAERISCSPFGGDPLSLLPVSRAARHRSLRVRAVFYRPLPCIPACYSP